MLESKDQFDVITFTYSLVILRMPVPAPALPVRNICTYIFVLLILRERQY